MALTMINPTASWFKIAELPVVKRSRQTVNGKELLIADEIFDKTSERIANLVNKTWLCTRYPRCRHLIYDNGSEFKLHFEYLCESYGIKRKPTRIKNPQVNGILDVNIKY